MNVCIELDEVQWCTSSLGYDDTDLNTYTVMESHATETRCGSKQSHDQSL